VDANKLEALTKAAPPAPAKPKGAVKQKPEDLSKANEKLSSLLRKPK
jgi:hypothetical protein